MHSPRISQKSATETGAAYPRSVITGETEEAFCSRNSHEVITTGSANITCKRNKHISGEQRINQL